MELYLDTANVAEVERLARYSWEVESFTDTVTGFGNKPSGRKARCLLKP